MAEILNLRRARKARLRAAADQQAAVNRSAFGRTKAERERDQHVREAARQQLDGARLDEPGDDAV